MRRQAGIVAADYVDGGALQVLDEGAALRHVEQLQPAADRQHRQAVLERLVEHPDFELIPLVVGRFISGVRGLAVARRVEVRAAAQE